MSNTSSKGPSGASALRRLSIVALAITVLWAGCAHNPAASTTGILTGKLVDEDGVGIAAARVRLEGTSTEVVTGPDGDFRFPPLPAGTYQIEVIANTLTRFKEGVRINGGRVTEVELTRTYLSIEPEFYGTPAESLAGRFHRIAFAPRWDACLPNARWDSVRAVIEPLLVQELRSVGFEVVEREVGTAICKYIADSLGGNFDPRAGAVDRERVATLHIQTWLTLVDRHKPDGWIEWGLFGSKNARVLSVGIQDRGGVAVYSHEVDGGAHVTPEEIARGHSDYPPMLKSAMTPFYRAVLK